MSAQGAAPQDMRSASETRWWSKTEYGHFARYDDEAHTAEWEGITWRRHSDSPFFPLVLVYEIPGEESR